MSVQQVTEIDVAKQTVVVRDATAEELAQMQLDAQNQHDADQAE